jgi:hypothetical protein
LLVGNDLVDLSDSDSDPATRHPRFDARVFSASELSALRAAPDRNLLRWSLWAAKEAAYKVARKLDPSAIFSPARFIVELEDPGSGRVSHGARSYCVRIRSIERIVHAIARPAHESADPVVVGMRRLGEGENRGPEGLSRAVRELVVERLAPRLAVQPEELAIRRSGRIPQLWLRAARLPIDLSLSHHGSAVGFAAAGRAR